MPDQRTDWKAGFESIPGPPPRPVSLEVVTDPEPEEVAPTTAPPRKKKVTAIPATKAPTVKPAPDTDSTRSASFWVPREVRTRLDAECARTGLSLTERAVDAFNAKYSSLSKMFVNPDRPSGPIPTRRVRRRRASSGEMVQLFLRLTPAEEEVLDEAIAKYGAPSRSALISAVLDADLP